MTRIFWDAMIFIYLLQDDPVFGERAAAWRRRCLERGDLICTSALAVAEVTAGVQRDRSEEDAREIRKAIISSGVHVLPFDAETIDLFANIRSTFRSSSADTIHLACAAKFGVDLFLTQDSKLHKLHVPGIKFIAGLDANL